MPLLKPDYQAPGWALGRHFQTIIPARISSRPKISYRREHRDLPDGDFLLYDWVRPEPLSDTAPVLVHFHGLEGSSDSHYAVALMDECRRRGWRGVVACYRSCGGELNRLPRAYFAGDVEDCDWVLQDIHARYPGAPMYVVGVSIGGNYIAKYLGEMGQSASFVKGAASVGAPMDLVAGSRVMVHGANRMYTQMFLRTLCEKVRRKIQLFGDFIDVGAFEKIKNLNDFDNVYTAPVHGFLGAVDYWTRCSAKAVLGSVRVPLLALNAKNDPFQPASVLPRAEEVSNFVFLDQPEEGGHIGFPVGRWPFSLEYLPHRIFRFFEQGT